MTPKVLGCRYEKSTVKASDVHQNRNRFADDFDHFDDLYTCSAVIALCRPQLMGGLLLHGWVMGGWGSLLSTLCMFECLPVVYEVCISLHRKPNLRLVNCCMFVGAG